MNKNLIILVKIIFQLAIILTSTSCNTSNNEKNEYTENIILDVKTDIYEYKVYENHSKVNSDNIDQCEKFFEYTSNAEGFEIYGADIADLYATFSNIGRNKVELKNKKAIFYTVIYKGEQNDSVNNVITKYLLDKRNLQVAEYFSEVNAFTINVDNTNKIAEYINKNNSDESSRILLKVDNYELTNVNLKIIATTLNELYPNTFFYKGDDETKYNLKIPLKQDLNAITDYLSKNYGIESSPSVETIKFYEIINRLQI